LPTASRTPALGLDVGAPVRFLALLAAEPLCAGVGRLLHVDASQVEPLSRTSLVVAGNHIAVADFVAVAVSGFIAIVLGAIADVRIWYYG
jgi:hypothetical protein